MQKTVETLIKVRNRLSSENKWTQHVLARDARDILCQPHEKIAVCWCLSGALLVELNATRTTPIDILTRDTQLRQSQAAHFIARAIKEKYPLYKYTDNSIAITRFNDKAEHAEVISILDDAIELAQSNIVNNLQSVLNLLDSESKWTKTALSRDAEGKPNPIPQAAVCWCLEGAIAQVLYPGYSVYPEYNRLHAYTRCKVLLIQAIREDARYTSIDPLTAISQYNDDPNTTYSNIVRMLQRAIQLAEQEKIDLFSTTKALIEA